MNSTETKTLTHNDPILNQAPHGTVDGVDYRYSYKTKTEIIKSVALFAIALVGFIGYVTNVIFTVSYTNPIRFKLLLAITSVAFILGLIGGCFTAIRAAKNHTKEIAEREFAVEETSCDIQLNPYLSAVQYERDVEVI